MAWVAAGLGIAQVISGLIEKKLDADATRDANSSKRAHEDNMRAEARLREEQRLREERMLHELSLKDKQIAELGQITKERDAQRQKALIEELERKNADALAQAQKQYQEEANKQRQLEREKFDEYKTMMEKHQQEEERRIQQQIKDMKEADEEGKKKLLEQSAQDKARYEAQMQSLENQIAEREEANKKRLDEMMKVIEKKNYESHYPPPQFLRDHLAKHPKSFNLQILGCRGAGKSTFVTKVMKTAKLNLSAKTGTVETTKETAFFPITDVMENKPDRYDTVFVVDQPGIGGLEITEADYLSRFGPGHYNFTLMLGEKGFNEIDLALLKHLLHNKKPLAFVRTQCDAQISGIIDDYDTKYDEELTKDQAFAKLKKDFDKYIENDVLTKVNMDNMEIFYIGLPIRDFPDFKRLVNYMLSGDLLQKIGQREANEAIIKDI